MTVKYRATNDLPLTLAHLTPIHLLIENYLIFFVFLPKNIAHTRLGIVFAYSLRRV